MLLDGVRWALGTHILIKVKLLMWNCSEDEFAFTDTETQMRFRDLDGALRSKHKHSANISASPWPAYLFAASLLPAFPYLCMAVSLPESSQGGDDVSMKQGQQQQVCLSPRSCLNISISLSREMADDAQDLGNGNSYNLVVLSCPRSCLIHLLNFGD